MHSDAYQLRNLAPLRKILETTGLLLFTGLFVMTWVISVRAVRDAYTPEAIFYYFGNVLTDIRGSWAERWIAPVARAGGTRMPPGIAVVAMPLAARTVLVAAGSATAMVKPNAPVVWMVVP